MSHDLLFTLLACLFGFLLTWGVGANDLANVFSPTLGAKAITIRQTIIIALIFELCGALLGGGKVAATIQHGIVDTSFLQSSNYLVYGMLAALLASSVWITFASHIGIPVSLTNSIVGSVVGFGTLVLGFHAVHWHTVGFIGLSWLICPISAGIIAFLLFFIIKRRILSTQEPIASAKKVLPFFLFLVGFVLSELTLIKGLRHFDIEFNLLENILIATVSGFFIVIFGQVFLRRIYSRPYFNSHEQFALIEKAFSVLMLFTICAMVYAHGSDDIATATGPVAAIISQIHPNIGQNSNILLLILTGGYFGVIIGFLTFGRKVVSTVGSRITELTPSRAFSATLAAAMTVVTSTNIGIPVSATQTLVGAILGVGFARGIGAIDLRIVRNIFLSWFITLPVTAILTMLFFHLFKLLFG